MQGVTAVAANSVAPIEPVFTMAVRVRAPPSYVKSMVALSVAAAPAASLAAFAKSLTFADVIVGIFATGKVSVEGITASSPSEPIIIALCSAIFYEFIFVETEKSISIFLSSPEIPAFCTITPPTGSVSKITPFAPTQRTLFATNVNAASARIPAT